MWHFVFKIYAVTFTPHFCSHIRAATLMLSRSHSSIVLQLSQRPIGSAALTLLLLQHLCGTCLSLFRTQYSSCRSHAAAFTPSHLRRLSHTAAQRSGALLVPTPIATSPGRRGRAGGFFGRLFNFWKGVFWGGRRGGICTSILPSCRNGLDMIQSQPLRSSFKLINSLTFSSLMFKSSDSERLDKFSEVLVEF